MDPKRRKIQEEAGESEACSTAPNDTHRKAPIRRATALFVNSNSLPAWFIASELLPVEERKQSKRYFIPKWFLPAREADYFFDSTIFPVMETSEEFSLNEFPNELLVEVFRRVHFTDRIHSVSLVCRRWNRLLYTPGLWTSVRMKIQTEEQFNAAEAFLKREVVSHSLIKLDLYYDRVNELLRKPTTTVLPERLPKLLHYQSVEEIVETGFEFLDEAMPMLQTLILKRLHFREGNRIYGVPPNSFSTDTAKRLFKKVRNYLFDGPIFSNFLWPENVKELNIHSGYIKMQKPKYPELQKLRLWVHFFRDNRNEFLRTLRISPKLVTLDVSILSYFGDEAFTSQFIAAVRNLHFLEHLRLSVGVREFRAAGLFAPPGRKSDFPSRLKHLSLSCRQAIVVKEITLNCPELRSLYLDACYPFVISESMFKKIADGLRKLEYLHLNRVRSSVASLLNSLGEDALPHLRYLHSSAYFNLTPAEMADVESLLSKRPNFTVVFGKLSSNTCFINGKAHISFDRSFLCRLLGSEEEACCALLLDFNAK